jgi:hypothetical protein
MPGPGDIEPTVRDVVERALRAHGELADRGESVEDEWTYVNDLRLAWADRLRRLVADGSGDLPAPPAMAAAIDLAIEEIARIEDPHRSIDWLSTFPQLVGLAVVGTRR